MWEAFYIATLYGSFCLLLCNLIIFTVIAWVACEYIRVRRQVIDIAGRLTLKMNELIDELLEAEGAASGASSVVIVKDNGGSPDKDKGTGVPAACASTWPSSSMTHRERLGPSQAVWNICSTRPRSKPSVDPRS